jgi:polyhydroxyalkanoate synthesis regulator phasin
MAQSPDWQQFLEAGMHFTAMTRAEAQRRARELVREGQLAQERVQAFVEELLDTSRKRADEFVDAVRHEVERQLKLLGVASRRPGRRPAAPTAKTAKTAKKTKKTKKTAKKPAKKAEKAAKKSAKSAKKKASGTATKKSAARKATKAAKKSATAATTPSP